MKFTKAFILSLAMVIALPLHLSVDKAASDVHHASLKDLEDPSTLGIEFGAGSTGSDLVKTR